MERAYRVDDSKTVLHEILVMLHVLDDNLQHVVVVAGDVVASGYLLDLFYSLGKHDHVLTAVLFQSDVAEHGNAFDFRWVQHSHVLLDVAFLL